MKGAYRWLDSTATLLFCLALVWGLMRFGAAETQSLYTLLLLLLVPLLLVLAAPLRDLASLPFLPLIALGLLCLGQVVVQAPLQAEGWAHLAIGWISLFLTVRLVDGGSGLIRFLPVALVAMGGIEAAYGLVQVAAASGDVALRGATFDGVATGTLINRNHFAALLNLIWPLALAVWIRFDAVGEGVARVELESRARLWTGILSTSIMASAVLLSRSRAGTLTLLMAALLLAVLIAAGYRKVGRTGGLSIGAGFVLTVCLLGMAMGAGAVIGRFDRVDQHLDRLTVYRDTVNLIADHPMLGIGPGMYEWRFRPYQTADTRLLFDHAHSDYLESAAEWGLPIAVLIWGWILLRVARTAAYGVDSRLQLNRGVAIGATVGLSAMLLQSLVDFPLQIPAVLATFCVVLGIAWRLHGGGGSPLQRVDSAAAAGGARSIDVALRATLLIFVVIAGWRSTDRLRALRAAEPRHGVAGLETSIELEPRAPDTHFLLGMAYRDLPGYQDLEAGVEHLRRSVALNPWNWRYQAELAQGLELRGDLEAARAALVAAVRSNPHSGTYRWRLANLDLRSGATEAAVAEIFRSVELDPRLTEAALTMLSRLQRDRVELDRLLPQAPESLEGLLRSLLDRPAGDSDLALVEMVWSRLAAGVASPTWSLGADYVRRLLERVEPTAAKRAWVTLANRNGIHDPAFEQGADLIWNGAFENPVAGPPLGWSLGSSPHFRVRVVEGEGIDGSRALRIDFGGTENLDFFGVHQLAVVEGGAVMRLSLALRLLDVSSDKGVYLEVTTTPGDEVLFSSREFSGTSDWQTVEALFSGPANAGTVSLRLRRQTSSQLDGKLGGSVWIDNVRLEPEE